MPRAVYASSKSDECETPEWFFDWCSSAWGPFDLDPAATLGNTKCQLFWTAPEDGLSHAWVKLLGNPELARVWCNPPYSQIAKWVERGASHAREAGTALFLVPARTDTRWFHDHAIGGAAEIVPQAPSTPPHSPAPCSGSRR